MALSQCKEITTNLLHSDLDGPFATKVAPACFIDEAENEVDFFRLWGRVVRRHYEIRTTITTYQFVEGEDLELFNLIYGEG